MTKRNGITRAVTAAPAGERGDVDKGFKTKGLIAALKHPTPRKKSLKWRCAGHPEPDLFHPTDEEALAEAVAFCAGCPVRALCGDLGRARGEYGVWGGVLLEGGRPRVVPRKPGRPKNVAA